MIYLDNNATTQIHPEVAEAIEECHRAGYANPASQHFAGRRARRALEEARTAIAEILGAKTTGIDADRVIFTSGGTEANNLAIRGLAGSVTANADGGQVVLSALEHPSVVAIAEHMAADGYHLQRIPVNRDGVVRLEALQSLLTQQTRVVSLMLGNNETGVIQPVADAVTYCRQWATDRDPSHRGDLRFHTDAVQCAGKIPVHFRSLGVDTLSVSAHKFHGPTGIGALVVRHGIPLEPILFGGVQQGGLRPGTESVPLAVGMCRGLQIWDREREQRTERLRQNRDLLEQELRSVCSEIVINGEKSPRLPHTSNIAFLGLDRQALVMALDMAGVACSTGSACASGSSEPSPVLLAMGLEPDIVSSSIRLSLSTLTTADEVLQAVRCISRVVNDLRRLRKSSKAAPAPPKPESSPV